MMKTTIPSATEIANALRALSHRQLTILAKLSGVPFTTLMGIRESAVKDPRIETVRRFLPHVADAAKV